MRRLGWILFAIGWVAVLSAPASAAPSTSTFGLSWSSAADPPCIAVAVLEEAVSARLGRNPFVPAGQADVVLQGRELPAVGLRLRAIVEQRDRQGRVLGGRNLDRRLRC